MSGKIQKTEFEKMLERKAAEEESHKAQSAPEHMDESAEVVTPAPPDAARAEEPEIACGDVSVFQAECEQLKDQLLRARAEFDNYRKRMLRDMDQARQSATSNLIRGLLPVLDNLERALAHANEEDGLTIGVRMVYKQMLDVFTAEGLEPIPALGVAFDPALHDALAMMPSQVVAHGIILEEFERGYKIREQVLRPAKVVVSSGPESGETAESNPDEVPQEEETPLTGE